jgi:hypothetical protein
MKHYIAISAEIPYIKKPFMKFAQLKCGRDLQYHKGVEEIVKCCRKRGACICPSNYTEIFPKLKVEDNFISEYIYKIIQLKFGRDSNQPYGGRVEE